MAVIFVDFATPDIYTLSLHDALPICGRAVRGGRELLRHRAPGHLLRAAHADFRRGRLHVLPLRSEEHTSELQSQFHLVCRLLLEKKKYSVELVMSLWLLDLSSDLVFN